VRKAKATMPKTKRRMRVFRVCIFRLASALWAATICFPLPAATVRMMGLFGSSEFGYTRMSWSSSLGRSSAMALASIDLPVPGDPIIITCRRWMAAFRITSTA
jgi:hypothetical protein